MRWIGEGPHIAIFDILFDLGYDPSDVESPRSGSWPKPCDPNWISEEMTPDPFFIEMMSEFVKRDPGKIISMTFVYNFDTMADTQQSLAALPICNTRSSATLLKRFGDFLALCTR